MAGEENLQKTKAAYEAFQRGDAQRAMEDLADDIEWVVAGHSSISGTYHGKQEVGQFWAKLAEKGFRTQPQYWFSDDERVVVLTQITIDGQTSDQADVLTFRDGKVVRFQSAGDTALMEQVWGSE
jgi:ketosteroid isomerase-like protein